MEPAFISIVEIVYDSDLTAAERELLPREPDRTDASATIADWMPTELLEAWLILSRDLDEASAIRPALNTTLATRNDDLAAAMTWWPDGSGAGIHVSRTDPLPERVAQLGDQFIVHQVEALWAAGRSPVWPPCPLHPDSHPLRATLMNGAAVWQCGDALVAEIGSLRQRDEG